ncbi:ATP-dependent Clp protease proteolytic subunit [Aquibium sp. LZ166]|uniref:ATP-dependent Clp protease proteolytic subunit n=1 Tax=Aquibium pacificus TaxID=3153579 RepID=A0ABV3SJH2_9HYPH
MDPFPRPALASARAALAATAPQGASRFLRLDIKGDITPATAKRVQRALRAAPAAKTVWLVVDSLGGDVGAAVACYRALREHPGKVISNAYRDVASAAILPYLAGDVRNAQPGARFMLHAAAIKMQGTGRWTADRYQIHADAIREADNAARTIILGQTGMHPSVLDGELDDDADMPIHKAVSTGIVHFVPGLTQPLSKDWPEKARAAMSASRTIAFGANGYRFSDSYLAACAA